MTTDGLEFRATAELRVAGRTLTGIAAPYDVEAKIGGTFTEVFRRSAFDATLASGADVTANHDHDPGRLLGRRKSGTLTLANEHRGLAFTLTLPDTAPGRDVLALAERGDLGGVSVGMVVVDQAWSGDKREIRSATLVEIAIISSWPAYPDTSVALRARGLAVPPIGSLARRRLLDMA